MKKLLFLATLLFVTATAWARTPPFQFVDVTTTLHPPQVISPTADWTSIYLDCDPSLSDCDLQLSNGTFDGQIATFICNSSLSSTTIQWQIHATFNAIDVVVLGGPDLGSFDQGLTVNPGNGSSSSDRSCGATLMWSNSNQWWELVNIYGGTDN